MNMKIDKNRTIQFHAVTNHKEEAKKSDAKTISAEQLAINQFKEQNSRENNRTTEIYYKFRSGKKLTPEELDYIAKKSPELYHQIKEIMQERQAMEAQMEMVESKEEVEEVRIQEVNKIQATMGKGKEAAAQAEKTMARVNQINAAYTEYTATLDYKEKEDIESETEEQRERLEELKRQQEAYVEKIKEKSDIIAESENADETSTGDAKKADAENTGEILEEAYDFDEDKEVRSKKKNKKKTSAMGNELFRVSIDYDTLRKKVRELYRTEQKNTTGNGKDIDVSL